ncbi:MAG: hypothetical protein KI792_13315 [Alphaproteobacteria bacterium]|nr:hypothetical protein [Alphaproteobacteria bacterium SS10]
MSGKFEKPRPLTSKDEADQARASDHTGSQQSKDGAGFVLTGPPKSSLEKPMERNLALELLMEDRQEKRSRTRFFISFTCFNVILLFLMVVVYGSRDRPSIITAGLVNQSPGSWTNSTGLMFLVTVAGAIAMSYALAKFWALFVTEGNTMLIRAVARIMCVMTYFSILAVAAGSVTEAIGWFFTMLVPAFLYWLAFRRVF